jgi:competence protein ComFC
MLRYSWGLGYRVYRNLWFAIDWLFPPVCSGCNSLGSRWCLKCREQTEYIFPPWCQICGLPLQVGGACPTCRLTIPAYTALRSWSVFSGPLRKVLLRLKYQPDLALAEALVLPLLSYVKTLHWPIDGVIPVPLARTRQRNRGYNQVALVAFPLALAAGWPYLPGALTRTRETLSQVGLTAGERQVNVNEAFRAHPRLVHGKTLLLVDDVATTGATLSSCAQSLLAAGAQQVFALSIARALPHHGLKDA